MSVTIVHITLIEEKRVFNWRNFFWPMNIKTKWFFNSFGQEDQVITLIANSNAAIKIFTLYRPFVSGNLWCFQNVKEVRHIEVYFPEATAVQNLLNAKGPNSFMSRLKIEKSVVLSGK
jgi:phosphoadenosine phosphosulfate reductase